MDPYSLQVANMLVGNDPFEAVIEMHFPASAFLFARAALIALAGADFSPAINGEPIPLLHPVIVQRNDLLHFQRPLAGARAYLAVAGGFEIEAWMGSKSTHLKAGVGGYKGRALWKEDEIRLKQREFADPQDRKTFHVLPWQAEAIHFSNRVAVLRGKEWKSLRRSGKEIFMTTPFLIGQQSDRMGYRLDNLPIPVIAREELVSAAVSFGTLQLLPNGKLILLMADHQATGGYPRIAHVISAHHPHLAQIKGGDRLFFEMVNQQQAEDLFLDQNKHLKQLQTACMFRLQEYLNA
jgi:antagonist of KipI